MPFPTLAPVELGGRVFAYGGAGDIAPEIAAVSATSVLFVADGAAETEAAQKAAEGANAKFAAIPVIVRQYGCGAVGRVCGGFLSFNRLEFYRARGCTRDAR
jgi:hypothetical protein